ncbi:hypothetical protein DV738_g4431, partial [Chaetothyriales sp. CBS 135597]
MPIQAPPGVKSAFVDPAVPALQVGGALDFRHALLVASQQPRTRRLELGCSAVAGTISGAVSGIFNRNPSIIRPALLAGALSTGAQALFHAFRDAQHRPSTDKPLVDRIVSYLPLQTLTDAQYERMLQEKLGKINVEIAILDDQIAALKGVTDPTIIDGEHWSPTTAAGAGATSLTGALLILYLASFVLLACLRIATGISIQRVGYFSLRHISYSPREGVRISLRALGLSLHRPTFAQPTWVSIVLTDLRVNIDPTAPESSSTRHHDSHAEAEKQTAGTRDHLHGPEPRSEVWQKLTSAKEKLKRLHSKIKWLRALDISAANTSLEIQGVGSFSVGSLTMAVHTRKKLLDRGRLFRHKRDPQGDQRAAEWIFTVKSVMLGVDGLEPVEVLDAMTINIHGLLFKDLEGLRDSSIAVKAGRLYVPVDDLLEFSNRRKRLAKPHTQHHPVSATGRFSTIEEEDLKVSDHSRPPPLSREASFVQTVDDSKEFFSSILRGVQECQIGLSFIRISKELENAGPGSLPLIANLVTHEIGIDLHRLDQNAPAHRMSFSRDDVAHQALAAAVSLSVSLDEDDGKSYKIMYVPMATTTIRTTLPSKTIALAHEPDIAKRNTNVLFANLVITSPSIDLLPQQLIRLLALLPSRPKPPSSPPGHKHRLLSRLLPKASIKFSVHEPVVRFVLPVADPRQAGPHEYDMIISAVSSISLEAESSHNVTTDPLYSLASTFRLVSHQLYYQNALGAKHTLIDNDSLELKTNVTVSNEVLVVMSGTLRTFSILMVRNEVSKGVYNIVRHFKRNVESARVDDTVHPPKLSFLRRMPPWLLELHFEGTNFSAQTAGVDENLSSQTRGLALELESWTVDYRSQQAEASRPHSSRRKHNSAGRRDESFSNVHHLSPPTSPSRHHVVDPADGRRLTIHARGLDGFIIEGLDHWEHLPFLSIPRFEIACSTSRDMQGPVFHIHSAIRSFYLDFSLYRLYSIGVAGSVLKDAFLGPPVPPSETDDAPPRPHHVHEPPLRHRTTSSSPELLTIDVKATLIQVKARLPADPPLMLQLYEISTGRHRWSPPFLRCALARLHVESPHLKQVWARLVTTSSLRLDLRHNRKKTAQGYVEEKSIDITTDLVRLSNPNGLRMYLVFDNIANTFKAVQQLHHRFKTRTNDYILHKGPKSPAKVPRVTLRTKALMFELEDDPFEWKLSNIYHVGRVEQKQRLARADAFELKVRKINEEKLQRSSTKYRAQSTHARSPPRHGRKHQTRARSQDSGAHGRSSSRTARGRRSEKIRYDRDGACAFTGSSEVTADEAWKKLQEHDSRSWKRRFDSVLALQNNAIKNIRKLFINADQLPHDAGEHENILDIPTRPGLLSIVISDVHLVVDKPSFPMNELPRFMHEIGKGMPYSMQYALLIPMSLSLDMGEARVFLRDYPLNMLHIPPIRPGQSPRLPSWSFRTDFVIAEEFRGEECIRHRKVDIVPKGQHGENGEEIPGFSIDVRRTVTPVKTYSKPVIDVNTTLPTTISWGTSYQPVIQDVMVVLENFTKPEIDPSDRVGFWDKIRMSFHSRLTINWKGDGDVQFRLKGSRDPYSVTGYGVGFVMCWRNDVQWLIHPNDDPKKFMTVRSGEFVLAIPDYSNEARHASDQLSDGDRDSVITSSHTNNAIFQKVIMKVTGNVQWKAGLVFERDLDDGTRTSQFIPHYEVILRNPHAIKPADLPNYDAFRGFRSNHIHMSIEVAAPFDRDWTSDDTKHSESYNSVHLSPRFFSHFYNWWSLFSSVMSLPIRQGSLWKAPEKNSKKFGRHLATIKYGLLLSPLFIAHIYKHKDAEDYQEDHVSATGLKLRIDSFVLDLHQRREYFNTVSKTKSKQMRTSAMKINRAELDFVRADLRAVSANIAGTTAEDLKNTTHAMLTTDQANVSAIDLAKFDIPDLDFTWIDMDDFVELDWILPTESNPETRILPLAFTPRFTYFRQTDHADSNLDDQSRVSPFGNEDTHTCMMRSNHNDPRRVQIRLIEARLRDVNDKLISHRHLIGEQELKAVRDGPVDPSVKEFHQALEIQKRELETKQKFLEHGLRRLAGHSPHGEGSSGDSEPPSSSHSSTPDSSQHPSPGHVDLDGLSSASQDEFASNFNNRFIVHNVQLKWNNAVRNTILRYSHQVIQRRGFVYYRSRRAVKFILDIVEEQAKAKASNSQKSQARAPAPAPNPISPTEDKDDEYVIQDRIDELLNVAHRFVHADEAEASAEGQGGDNAGAEDGEPLSEGEDGDKKLADSFLPVNSYHLRLIAPQIQLQSDQNTKAVVLVSAKGIQLKIVSIMDKLRLSDDVSGLVQRRFASDMDGAQFFVSNQKLYAKYNHLHTGNRYGCPAGADWPPWVPLDAMFDFHLNPFGFQRVIQKTSASMRYEQYNPLRLKYNEEVASEEGEQTGKAHGSESRFNHLWVDFPRIRASCDSTQYYTMYMVVLDLLLYSEPLEKTRSERLEKIMLASDFSDLRGAPEMAEKLQERIRQLDELKLYFQVNAKYLDEKGWEDRIDLEKDLANCEDELFFIMKAINTSQQRNDERKSSLSSGLLRWYLSANEIVWHLMRDKDDPLLEFQLYNAAYERIDNTDGSNHNAMEIEHIRGWNLLKNALYPDIIGPYHEEGGHKQANSKVPHKMAAVRWYKLEAIAGIPVLEDFQVTMHSLKVQLERELGKKLFEYVFPHTDPAGDQEVNSSTESIKATGLNNDDEAEGAAHGAVILGSEDDTPRTTTAVTTEGTCSKSSLGSIARRLTPTYNLNSVAHRTHSPRTKNGGQAANSEHHTRLFRHGSRSESKAGLSADSGQSLRKASATSLTSSFRKGGSATNLAMTKVDERKWSLHRTASNDQKPSTKSNGKGAKPTDDVSQMVSRASNYMTLAHVKMNGFVVCLSYKGKGDRNLEDLRDFVFRLPTLEYHNKTWSNLDLALRVKKDIIRALISHTGAIIGNKFAHHKPSKKQQDALREYAHSVTSTPNVDSFLNTPATSETTSLYSQSEESTQLSLQSSQLGVAGFNGSQGLGIGSGSLIRTNSLSSGLSTPAETLLKDTLGRRFTGDTSRRSVHFGKSESDKHDTDDGGLESDPESHKKRSIVQKVACIAHKNTVLAEHAAPGTASTTSALAAAILPKISHSSPAKLTYTHDRLFVHYLSSHAALTYLVIAQAELGRRIPFAFLLEMKKKFLAQFRPDETAASTTATTTTPAYGCASFNSTIKQMLAAYAATPPSDALANARREIDSVKDIMSQNIESVLERGERIDLLVAKTDQLGSSAHDFRLRSKTLRRRMWFRNVRLMLLLAFVALFLVYLFVGFACGLPAWGRCVG